MHFNEPNEYIEGLKDGSLKVVSGETPFPGGYIGVNSFGFGGSNTHVILRAAEPQKALPAPEQPAIPKVFFYSGRTKEGVENIFENVKQHIDNHHLHQLLAIQVKFKIMILNFLLPLRVTFHQRIHLSVVF